MSFHPHSFRHTSSSHFCTEVKVLFEVQLSKQKASKCFSWSRFRFRLEFKRIINEKNMDFSSLYLTPHYLLSMNENFASTIQEKFTHKWLNFESFQAGMMTLSKIGKWERFITDYKSRQLYRVSGRNIRFRFIDSVSFGLFPKKQIRFQETKLSKIDKQPTGKPLRIIISLATVFHSQIKVQF